MSNLQAALGVAQLERLTEFVQRKRKMGSQYNVILKGVAELQLPLEATDYAENIYWVYGVVLDDKLPFHAQFAMEQLAQHQVGTRPFFWPIHEQPVFHRMGLFRGVRCPVAERLARRGFYLPSGLAVTDSQQRRVADALKTVSREPH